jgi:SAM-dependent methyltransferase
MKVTALKQVHYDPAVFTSVETVDDAVRVILTPEEGMTSAHRWKNEAPYLMKLIKPHIEPGSLVLDYGCGIGRLAKPLIEMLNCQVVGVDISANMRALATSCVESPRFFAMAPAMLGVLRRTFDAAIAVWTLQHVHELALEISRIRDVLAVGGVLFVVNNKNRVIPGSHGGWIDDGKDVQQGLVEAGFSLIERGELEGDDIAPGWLGKNTFWAAYRKS